jgi:hypothetical protein
MTALMQADSADQADRPVLLYYDKNAGHSRGIMTPVSKQIEDLSTQMLFLTWQLGMEAAPAAKPAKKAA